MTLTHPIAAFAAPEALPGRTSLTLAPRILSPRGASFCLGHSLSLQTLPTLGESPAGVTFQRNHKMNGRHS